MGFDSGSALAGAVRSSLRRGRSRVLRTYAIVAALVSVFTASLILLALPGWIARTDGTAATLMLAPGVLLLAGIAVIGMVMAPLLLATRRVPDPGKRRRLEALYGGFGYAVLLSLYAAMIISAPADQLGGSPAALEPAVDALNALPTVAGVVPPMVTVALFLLVDRRYAGS